MLDESLFHSRTPTREEMKAVGKHMKKTSNAEKRATRAENALWRLRWRHANSMVLLFKTLARSHPGESYYYTATGIGPADRRCKGDFGGITVEYKHTAARWVPIWQNVAEHLLKKVKEYSKKDGV